MRNLALRFITGVACFLLGLSTTTGVVFMHKFSTRPPQIGIMKGFSPALHDCYDETDEYPSGPICNRGLYYNYDYAYSVRIPKRMVGLGSTATNHGFEIVLSDSPAADIWMDASYNTLEWKSADQAINEYLSSPPEKGSTAPRVVEKSTFRWSGMLAERVSFEYNQNDQPMTGEMIFAFRPGSDIVYSLLFQTTRARYAEDRKVLEQLKESFRLERSPEP